MKSTGSRSINREVLRLAIPSILAGVTVPLVGMADTAIAGRLGTAAFVGGIAIGSMLFDWLYWNMGFLRMGTAGFTAIAYGEGNMAKCVKHLTQGVIVALALAVLVLLIQVPYANLCFHIIPQSSPTVTVLATTYFFIRVWAAPATLSLFTFRGWFIGMQNTVYPMVVDIVVNLSNIAFSWILAIDCKMGVAGIALGTVLAQYLGLIVAIAFVIIRYGSLLKFIRIREALALDELKRFFTINGNLFIRSICMLLVYSGFTALAAPYGDVPLAVATIMMKLLLLYSYFIDGFAYAGEALTGKSIGARDLPTLRKVVKTLFFWCAVIVVVSTIMYITCSNLFLGIMTSAKDIIEASQPYIKWLYLMPLLSCIAFTWDGIYVGATASASIRNTMIFAAVAFYVCYYALRSFIGFEALWYAYVAHLVVRSLYMTIRYKKEILPRC